MKTVFRAIALGYVAVLLGVFGSLPAAAQSGDTPPSLQRPDFGPIARPEPPTRRFAPAGSRPPSLQPAPAEQPVDAAPMAEPHDRRITLQLRDGSRLLGTPDGVSELRLKTEYGELTVPLEKIDGIRFSDYSPGSKDRAVGVLFKNGDTLSAKVLEKSLKLKTSFGEVEIPCDKLDSVVMSSKWKVWVNVGGWKLVPEEQMRPQMVPVVDAIGPGPEGTYSLVPVYSSGPLPVPSYPTSPEPAYGAPAPGYAPPPSGAVPVPYSTPSYAPPYAPSSLPPPAPVPRESAAPRSSAVPATAPSPLGAVYPALRSHGSGGGSDDRPTTTHRNREVIFTSEDLRSILNEWERIWHLDMPEHETPFRTHGGII